MKAEILIAVNLPIQTIRHIKLVTGLMPQILRRKVRSTIPLYNRGVSMFFVEQPRHVEYGVSMPRKAE